VCGAVARRAGPAPVHDGATPGDTADADGAHGPAPSATARKPATWPAGPLRTGAPSETFQLPPALRRRRVGGEVAAPAFGRFPRAGLARLAARGPLQPRQDLAQAPGGDALLGQQRGGEAVGLVLEVAGIAELREQHRN